MWRIFHCILISLFLFFPHSRASSDPELRGTLRDALTSHGQNKDVIKKLTALYRAKKKQLPTPSRATEFLRTNTETISEYLEISFNILNLSGSITYPEDPSALSDLVQLQQTVIQDLHRFYQRYPKSVEKKLSDKLWSTVQRASRTDKRRSHPEWLLTLSQLTGLLLPQAASSGDSPVLKSFGKIYSVADRAGLQAHLALRRTLDEHGNDDQGQLLKDLVDPKNYPDSQFLTKYLENEIYDILLRARVFLTTGESLYSELPVPSADEIYLGLRYAMNTRDKLLHQSARQLIAIMESSEGRRQVAEMVDREMYLKFVYSSDNLKRATNLEEQLSFSETLPLSAVRRDQTADFLMPTIDELSSGIWAAERRKEPYALPSKIILETAFTLQLVAYAGPARLWPNTDIILQVLLRGATNRKPFHARQWYRKLFEPVAKELAFQVEEVHEDKKEADISHLQAGRRETLRRMGLLPCASLFSLSL